MYARPGRLAGERVVEVAQANGSRPRLAARRAVVVATGTSAATPSIPGLLRDLDPWENRDVTAAKGVSGRLLVLGGGAIGCEMA